MLTRSGAPVPSARRVTPPSDSSFLLRISADESPCLPTGVAASQEQDFGTANLHVEVSDVVSVLVYVGVAKGNGVLSKTGNSPQHSLLFGVCVSVGPVIVVSFKPTQCHVTTSVACHRTCRLQRRRCVPIHS